MISEENNEYTNMLITTTQFIDTYKNTFAQNCQDNCKRISTGFLTLDKALNGGLSNELYIMGAETSTGKSAFMTAIAQNVAEAGTNVLYFALEMSKDEFIARGISSISFEHNRKSEASHLITAGNVLYWTYDTNLNDFTRMPYTQYEKYANEYFDRYGSNLCIIESGINNLTVNNIANIAAFFKKKSGKPVVVIIDYLQIIKADPEDRSQSDRKTRTDVIVATLKILASQIGMPVLALSSISRQNYNGKISSTAFKESGNTEYTGGILLGWNWTGVTDQKAENEREKEKKTCKERGYRKMSLEILKYRNAERDSSVHFIYYPAYNYFEEDSEKKQVPIKDTNDSHEEDNKEMKTYSFK